MRLAEKTIELTYCSQFSAAVGSPRLIWFGLTQKQEARAGFDACTHYGGRLFILQFKASCQNVSGGRRFHLPHKQLTNLRRRCTIHRSVFYALPMVGTTQELSLNSDVLSQTWLLDVATLPRIPPPTTKWGSLRKSNRHYLDVSPPTAILHSDPIELALLPSAELVSDARSVSAGTSELFDGNFEMFSDFLEEFRRNALGLVVIP